MPKEKRKQGLPRKDKGAKVRAADRLDRLESFLGIDKSTSRPEQNRKDWSTVPDPESHIIGILDGTLSSSVFPAAVARNGPLLDFTTMSSHPLNLGRPTYFPPFEPTISTPPLTPESASSFFDAAAFLPPELRALMDPSRHIQRPVTIFDDLPPLPDVETCNDLLNIYFNDPIRSAFAILHRERFYRGARWSNTSLLMSTLAVACMSHPSPTFHTGHRNALAWRLVRLLPQVLSQPATLDTLQTLCHAVLLTLSAVHVDPVVWMLTQCVRVMRESAGIGYAADDRWTKVEELKRTMWCITFLDRIVTAWRPLQECGVRYEEVAGLQLPCHTSTWALDEIVTATNTPTLDSFFDPEVWPMESTRAAKLEYFPLAMCLQVQCLGHVIDYRVHCTRYGVIPGTAGSSTIPPPSLLGTVDTLPGALQTAVDLNNATHLAMTTWYARFHASLGLDAPPISSMYEATVETNVTHRHPVMMKSPIALALFIQYHGLWGWWNSPIPPTGEGGSPNPIDTFGFDNHKKGSPRFIRDWVASPAFVACLEHARIATGALEDYLTLYGNFSLAGVHQSSWGFCLGMSVIPLIIAMREALLEFRRSADDRQVFGAPIDHELILRQLFEQTRAQVRLIVHALRKLSPTASGSSRGLAAARLIERLFNNIVVQESESSDQVVNWITEKGGTVVWSMVAVGFGVALSSGVPENPPPQITLEDRQRSVIAAIKDPLIEAGTTPDAVIDRSLIVLTSDFASVGARRFYNDSN